MAILQIVSNQSLRAHNTFKIDEKAKFFTVISSEDQLLDLYTYDIFKNNQHLVVGGGSNILFTQFFDGLIIKNSIQGISVNLDRQDVIVRAGGGVVWNDLVQYCVLNNYAGLENLSLIPGTVGASPVQNIGAYGVELEDVFVSCRAFDLEEGVFRDFSKEDCRFSYRDSIFKTVYKGRFLITEVCFRLSLLPNFNIKYGAIKEELDRMGVENLSISAVSTAVSTIRVNKLPDPSTIGNAGSFFKNPIIDSSEFNQLLKVFPDVVHYPAGSGSIKVAAGWLIEQAGFKGLKIGETGTWKNQALVLVNHGTATGQEVYDFSEKIIEDVYSKFNVKLEREVNIF